MFSEEHIFYYVLSLNVYKAQLKYWILNICLRNDKVAYGVTVVHKHSYNTERRWLHIILWKSKKKSKYHLFFLIDLLGWINTLWLLFHHHTQGCDLAYRLLNFILLFKIVQIVSAERDKDASIRTDNMRGLVIYQVCSDGYQIVMSPM